MKEKQVQRAKNILSEYITPFPGEVGLSSAVLIVHISDLERVNKAVLKWWEEHQFDTTDDAGERNMFDEEPDFVKFAKQVDDTTNGCKQCSLYNDQDRCPPDCGGNTL